MQNIGDSLYACSNDSKDIDSTNLSLLDWVIGIICTFSYFVDSFENTTPSDLIIMQSRLGWVSFNSF